MNQGENQGKIKAQQDKSWQIKTKKSKAVPSEARQKLENEEEIIGESRRISERTDKVQRRIREEERQIKANQGESWRRMTAERSEA